MYALYAAYGFSQAEIAQLFVAPAGASIFGTFVGRSPTRSASAARCCTSRCHGLVRHQAWRSYSVLCSAGCSRHGGRARRARAARGASRQPPSPPPPPRSPPILPSVPPLLCTPSRAARASLLFRSLTRGSSEFAARDSTPRGSARRSRPRGRATVRRDRGGRARQWAATSARCRLVRRRAPTARRSPPRRAARRRGRGQRRRDHDRRLLRAVRPRGVLPPGRQRVIALAWGENYG